MATTDRATGEAMTARRRIEIRLGLEPGAILDFPAGIGLEHGLRYARTADQANATIEIKCCQIAQTGYYGAGKRADADMGLWAGGIDDARRRREAKVRVPGTCDGCNSDPCRCWA